MAELTFGMNDNGNAVSAARNDLIVIEVPENPTTGYRWSLRSRVEPVLVLKQDSFERTAQPRPGAGGVRRMEFAASAQGEARILLWNWREWEGEGSVKQRYSITVTVK